MFYEDNYSIFENDNVDEIEEENQNIFAIHERFFPSVEKKIQRIIKKCKQYGNFFSYEILGEETREDSRAPYEGKYRGVYHKFIIVKVDGEAKVGNWEFIATLDMHQNGNVIRRFNTDVEIPDYYKTSPNVCDHCKTERNRKKLYLVRNIENGEFKQVGGNCLKSYTGISLNHIAAIMDGIDHLCYYNDMFDESYSSGQRYYSVRDVVSCAAVIINKVGYFNTESKLSTKTMVMDVLADGNLEKNVDYILNSDLCDHGYFVRFEKEEFEVDNSEEVNAIIEYYLSLEDNSEFVHNMQTIIKEQYVSWKDLGYLCYTPMGYMKHMEREVERAKRQAEKREHWGEVGKRYKNMPVQSVRKVAGFLTDFGIMNIWQIVLEDGIVLTWKTSNYLDDDIDTVSFTVKEHSEYNGVPQTIVTRCKFAA